MQINDEGAQALHHTSRTLMPSFIISKSASKQSHGWKTTTGLTHMLVGGWSSSLCSRCSVSQECNPLQLTVGISRLLIVISPHRVARTSLQYPHHDVEHVASCVPLLRIRSALAYQRIGRVRTSTAGAILLSEMSCLNSPHPPASTVSTPAPWRLEVVQTWQEQITRTFSGGLRCLAYNKILIIGKHGHLCVSKAQICVNF